MNNSRLGCLTLPGLLASLLTLAIVLTITLLRGGVLFTPGALNAQSGEPLGGYFSHAEFGNQCRLCHAPFWDPAGMNGRCQTCHTEIARQVAAPDTLHGAIYQASPASACRDCHPEHRGADAPLTDFANLQLSHEAFGFSLQGHKQHPNGQGFACQDCHTMNFSPFNQAVCQTCHQQLNAAFALAHLQDFGGDCLACHDGVDTYGRLFDHNRYFALTGKHAGLPCTACHANARSRLDLQGTPTDCYACHARDDAHRGEFGQDCAACHTPEDWKRVTFDHAKTRFPLTGAHIGLPCTRCHVNNAFKGLSTACAACHQEPAYHAGLFRNQTCEVCHTTAAWRPALFNQPHTFPLDHGGGTSCRTCHPNTLTAYTCYNCHEHDPAKIRQKHVKEGILDFQNCIACHPTGREKEGKQEKEDEND